MRGQIRTGSESRIRLKYAIRQTENTAPIQIACRTCDSALSYDCSEIEVTDVLTSADVLVVRWREKPVTGLLGEHCVV
jgi:hypothetical protein